MIGILACGLPPAPRAGDLPALRALTVPADTTADLGASIVDTVAPALAQGSTVVAVVPTWNLEPTLAQLHVARSALDTTRLVVHRTDLPPLAASVLAATVADLALRELLPDGVLVSSLPAIERHVVAAAWLGSVARLREPAPRLAQHARSYLPGTAFGVVIDADPRVVVLRRKEAATIDLPQTAVPGGWRATVSQGTEGDVEVIRRSLTAHAPGARTERVELTDVSTAWWGTDKLIEVALVPADLAALARAVSSEREPSRCAWCDEVIATDPCPFCGARASVPAPTLDEVPSGGRT